MRISVGIDGRVMVTTPRHTSVIEVEKFVAKHADWIARHVARARLRTVMRIPRKDVTLLKKQALDLAESRCAHFARIYGLTYKKISIRAQKSRWGSCSAVGNVSFNYKIAVLPAEMIDYIIVHEICHLAEMNHSKRFWKLVAQTVPDCIELRKKLRTMHAVIG
jgi:predicted metal-dependent hydrolase